MSWKSADGKLVRSCVVVSTRIVTIRPAIYYMAGHNEAWDEICCVWCHYNLFCLWRHGRKLYYCFRPRDISPLSQLSVAICRRCRTCVVDRFHIMYHLDIHRRRHEWRHTWRYWWHQYPLRLQLRKHESDVSQDMTNTVQKLVNVPTISC